MSVTKKHTAPSVEQWNKAWEWIVENWHCVEWTRIPPEIRRVIPFHSQLGMWGGMLVTEHGVRGVRDFIERMNQPMLL